MAMMKTMRNLLPIVIPTYEPEEKFSDFITSLIEITDKIIIVDDGSGEDFRKVFDEIEKHEEVEILRHAVNLGKGRSLKDAFNYVLNQYPDALGVITADADGQHLIADIMSVSDALCKNPDNLVLGSRNFGEKEIPWKSKFGNNLTRKICAFLCGVNVSDTQTGLRGIPMEFVKILMHTPGERYEYEINMLLECNNRIQITEVPIATIYDSKKDHKTHFRPLRDSITIYKIILEYSLSSVFATIIDFLLFSFTIWMGCGVWIATAAARAAAAFINFLLNRNIVFKSKGKGVRQLCKYVWLVVISGMISASVISYLESAISVNIFIIKTIVEICLFFFNYYIQRTFIFIKRKGDEIEKSLFSEEVVERTDWTKYYEEKKSWFSAFTQRYTLRGILAAIDRYVGKDSNICICEMGGGNSCFCVEVCGKKKVGTYDIIDNNQLAVKLFEKLEMDADEHKGICKELLMDTEGEPDYDFVYSVGLIEHFRGKNIQTIIDRHFEYCKEGGIVFITFPTPTRKYIFVRKCMEFFGIWKFYDEKPIRYEDIADCFEAHGVVMEHYINYKLPLTQEVVITRKGGYC